MRIRSIRPEFWSSEDVAAMDWHTRLVYIGLWSYVDDNGVGRDSERLIVAALFPLDECLSEASVRTHGALKQLETGGQITRYEVNGKRYLHIVAWDTHQKINRASASRYPLPDKAVTCGNETPTPQTHGALSEPSVSPHAKRSLGEGENGRRGEGEKGKKDSCASTDVERELAPSNPPKTKTAKNDQLEADFADWWATYPRKRGKGQALRAYRAARKKTTAEALHSALTRQTKTLTARGAEYCPYPATWLNGERWTDQPDAATPAPDQPPRLPHVNELEDPPPGLTDEQYLDWHRQQRERRRA